MTIDNPWSLGRITDPEQRILKKIGLKWHHNFQELERTKKIDGFDVQDALSNNHIFLDADAINLIKLQSITYSTLWA